MKIIWSAEAEKTYFETLEFIFNNWNIKTVESFEEKVFHILDLISENNKLFPASKKKSIYKAVISKQTSVIYRISKNEITLLYFIDNRSNHQYY